MANQHTPDLSSFGSKINAAVIGASGGIGNAFCDLLESSPQVVNLVRCSRSESAVSAGHLHTDLEKEESLLAAAAAIKESLGELHLVIIASGILHEENLIQPEKTWRGLDTGALETLFRINASGPALAAKHFLPLLARERKTAFSALSARVGSIEDNELGGWYAYRASKAALNMLIKTLSIELARKNKEALCIGLHPGSVDTPLSKPFQNAVPDAQLLSPKTSARRLLAVLNRLAPSDTGGLFAWDGQRIPF
ncbi:MAG: SDR family NAD(P)-dependent oxidoreductase [Kiloniellales bacterium]|nr:SDR family NAD(P)-dependent oxidoreductase [Kiloniellales bacterium]